MAKQNSGIDIPEGLDGVRHAYSMYLGGTGTTAIAQAVFEPLDNAFDECKAGRNDGVALLVDLEQNVYGVLDFGNGIPVTKGSSGVSTLTEVFTIMHATGKGAGGTAYLGATGTAGTHGVGLKVANAVCEYAAVITRRSGKLWHQSFSRGKVLTEVSPLKSALAGSNASDDYDAMKLLLDATSAEDSDTGTFVLLVPDNALLTDGEVLHPDVDAWADLLKTKALLNPGVTTTLLVIDEQGNPRQQTWCYETDDYVPELAESYGYTYEEDHVFSFASEDLQVSFVNVESGSSDLFDAYVSGRPTPHPQSEQVLGFRKALHTALLPLRGKRQEDKPFTPASVLRGVLGYMNIDIRGARFAGQNKERLVQQGVAASVQEQLAEPLAVFFASKTGAEVARKIIANAIAQEQLLSEQVANRKALKAAKKKDDHKDCYLAPTGNNTEAIELFVVEGDSAGGAAKYARQCSKTQGVLKLRGKYLNCARSKLHACASNKAINALATAISGSMEALLEGRCRIGKLMLTSDADSDGSHINLLHLALIDSLAPWLLEQGRVYVVQTPLYKAQVRTGKRAGDHFFAFDHKELEAILKREKLTAAQCNLTRFKGLGEMNSGDLATCVFNHATRRLLKLDAIKAKRDLAAFRLLISSDTSYRKRLLGFAASEDGEANPEDDDL